MKQIRKNVFETNSSSTHSIVITKSNKRDMERHLYPSMWWPEKDFSYYFGRDEFSLKDHWDEKLAYLYLAILYGGYDKETIKYFKKRVIDLYNQHVKTGLVVDCEVNPEWVFKSCKEGYIDHSECISKKFTDRCINDDKYLDKFLFNENSYICICGDEYHGYYIKTIGFEFDYDDHFIWYDSKGNEVEDINEYMKTHKKLPHGKYVGEFWDKLDEYKKKYDVYLKGN